MGVSRVGSIRISCAHSCRFQGDIVGLVEDIVETRALLTCLLLRQSPIHVEKKREPVNVRSCWVVVAI